MTPQGAGPQDSEAAAERAQQREEDAAAERQGYLVGGIFLATFAFIGVVMYSGSRPAEVDVTSASIDIRASGYYATVARDRIDSVKLVSQLTGLGNKLNAFQAGSAYAGLFELRPFGKARLFVNTSRPPYVMIFSRDGVVMVNVATPDATRKLYAELAGSRSAVVTP